VERKLKITRQLLEVFQQYRHPVTIVTRSAMIERDIDILADMAQQDLVQVAVSVTTLDRQLCRYMEPRATAPQRRIQAIRRLADHGIPVTVLFAPVIPMLNDNEVETILDACYDAGIHSAGYVMLRLPHELKQLFREWLESYYPLKANHVMNILREMRGGKDYDARFGQRQSGKGVYAELFAQRFRLKCKKLGIDARSLRLDSSRFTTAVEPERQLEMF
jgi:DNA repair photolyase